YVALLVILALFADLMVNRGEIPCLDNLPTREWIHYLEADFPLPTDLEARSERKREIGQRLQNIGVLDRPTLALAVDDSDSLSTREKELRRNLLWYADLPEMLGQSVGEDAARSVTQKIRGQILSSGVEAGVHKNLPDNGILSLVVRSRST